ncbi:hypothetical protein [Paractinoplanes lichenicola]|uniref:Uncharacterized protein n=1 Tax=Paractinoplanes lichenicola TaxID=2802976 RepID=A0ABS1VHV2_9ACTN|nr:hypothetical protein [Actinoplanes lichenicola]MBL7254291.1 hypothetical protein [Actinoplanes lichenicola]
MTTAPSPADLLGGAREAERLWAGLHGLVSLRLHKPHTPWQSDVEAEAARLAATTS